MLNKNGARILGLFILGVFIILICGKIALALSEGDMVDYATAKKLGYQDEDAYALAHEGSNLLTADELKKLSATPSATSSSSNSVIAWIQGAGDKVVVTVKGWLGGSGATATNINGVKYNSIFGLTEKQALIFSHILLGILFLIIIFTIIDVLPFFPTNSGLRFLVAIIITILSMMLLPSADIEAMMGTYQALGVVLTSIVPFLVMMAFTIKWDEKQPQYRFVSTIIWIGFIVYIGVRWVNMPADAALKWAYPITLALAIIFAIFKGWFVRMAIRAGIKGDFAKFDRLTRAEMRAEVAIVEKKIAALKEKTQTPSIIADIEELEDKKKALVKGVVNAA